MLVQGWRNDSVYLDAVIAVVAVAIGLIIGAHFGWATTLEFVLKDNRSAIYTALTSVFGALLGFTITAISVILALGSSPTGETLRKSKHYPRLWQTFLSAIWISGLATIISFIGLVFDRDSRPVPMIEVLALVIVLFASLRLYRVVRRIGMLGEIV